jgi:glycosyltransferase involved in cell wall biosynthesis
MSRRCEITVVIPTYNRAKLVGRAIESVLDQTVQPAQIILIDDGSMDGTAKVCQEYSRYIYYIWQANSGAAAARNAGIRLANQPWIAFLDSDDYFTPSHLERMATAIRETSGVAAFYFSDVQLPESSGSGSLWGKIGFHPRAPFHLTDDASPWVLFTHQPTMLQSSVISRQALTSVGGLNESRPVGEDSYLFCQLGIGGVACAVSGTGCVQTADDISRIRLTVANPLNSEKYLLARYELWRDVFSWDKRLPPNFRRLVAFKLASAHLDLGKARWSAGRRFAAILHFLLAANADARLAAWLVRKRSTKGYDETVRPLCAEL